MKTRPVRAELFHTQTGGHRHDVVTALRNFANALHNTLRRKRGQTRHIYCSIHVKLT